MTEIERLGKNNRIREKGKQTREKRKSQVCRVYPIEISHLNEAQKERLKMLFVEAKWLYNDALIFMKDHDISEYDTKIVTVQGLDKNRNSITHDLQYISSQIRQSVLRPSIIQGIKCSLKSLSSLKRKNHQVGELRYKSEYASINLQQHNVAYHFYDDKHISIHGFSKPLKIRGAKQFWNIPNLELANAKLLNLPDD